jgi:integrase
MKIQELLSKASRPPDHEDLVRGWKMYLRNKGTSLRTIETNFNLIKRYTKHLSLDCVNFYEAYQLTMTEAICGERKLSESSRQRLHFSILSLLEYFRLVNHLDNCKQIDEIKKLKPKVNYKKQKRTYLTAKQYAELLEENRRTIGNKPEEREITGLLIILYAELGARTSELVMAKVEDIDFENKIIRIRHGKGDKERYIGINDSAYIALKKLLALRPADYRGSELLLNSEGLPLTRRSIYKRIYRVGKRIGYAIGPHSLRRTNARNLILEGKLPSLAVSNHLGHSPRNAHILGQCYCITDEFEIADLISSTKGITKIDENQLEIN